jgi:hypothetical protein
MLFSINGNDKTGYPLKNNESAALPYTIHENQLKVD